MLEIGGPSNSEKMNNCSFHQHGTPLSFGGLTLKPKERAKVLLNKDKHFQYFNFETNFLNNEKPFQKPGKPDR